VLVRLAVPQRPERLRDCVERLLWGGGLQGPGQEDSGRRPLQRPIGRECAQAS